MKKNLTGLKGGVIIIGSLFWEDENNSVKGQEEKGKFRNGWRDNNLKMKQAFAIPLPVRYGRFSSKKNRKETYTMVLSKEYCKDGKMGRGLVVPFKKAISQFEDFYQQAEKLAEAEVIYDNADSPKLVANWGAAVALWINPQSKRQQQVKKFWKKIRSKKSDLGYAKSTDDFTWEDGSLLKKDYSLKLKDIESDLDFLFCTYIKPKHKEEQKNNPGHEEYPEPKEIADAMLASGYQTYFCQNRASGIVTSDDNEIISFLAKS